MTQTPALPAPYLERVRQLMQSGQRSILGLVGSPGSGKSTLATALLEHFPDSAQIVPMDGFHFANSVLKQKGLAHKKGAEDTFDSGGYVALLHRLRNSFGKESVYAPEFVRAIEEPIANAIEIRPSTRLVITEGNYLLLANGAWAQVRNYLDECWYVDVGQGLRTERLVQRHEFFGRSHQAALDWVANTDEPNARMIEATKDQATLVFNWG